MTNQPARSSARARQRAKQRAAQARTPRSGRIVWIAVAIVVVIGVALAIAARGGSKTSSPRSPAPAALVDKVTSIPESTFTQVGAGTTTKAPTAIDAPALTKDGKPHVLYVGGEYCPYCAAERWAVVIALSRFGSFSHLSVTHSSSIDVFPDTNTFSFYGATYTSDVLSFEAVEEATNQIGSNGSYQKLETLSAEQQQLVDTYDAPPYVSSKGGVPFVDFGGKYLVSGASFDPSVLQGKSADEIATALSDPSTAVSQGAVGAANTITAALCGITKNKPAAVCSTPTISGLASKLG